MSGNSDSVAPERLAKTLRGYLGYLDYLKGPAGYGAILSLYIIIGGLAWLIIQLQDSERTAPLTVSPLPAVKSTPVPEPTAVPTAVPAPAVVRAVPTVVVQPQPRSSYAVQPPAQGKFILIDQDRQTMLLFENGREVQRYPISSGVPGSRLTNTPHWTGHVSHYVGTFFAYGGYADNAWHLFRDLGDILIHSAPYTYVNGKKVYQDLDKLGQAPSSHGCIRMSPAAIEQLGRWGPQGALVHITPWTGNGPARPAAGS